MNEDLVAKYGNTYVSAFAAPPEAPLVKKKKSSAKKKAKGRKVDRALDRESKSDDDEEYGFMGDLNLEAEKAVRERIEDIMEDLKKFCLHYLHDDLREFVFKIEASQRNGVRTRYVTDEVVDLFSSIPKRVLKRKDARDRKKAAVYKKYMEENWFEEGGNGYKHFSKFVKGTKETPYLGLYNKALTLESLKKKKYIIMWINSIYFPFVAPDAPTAVDFQLNTGGAKEIPVRLQHIYAAYLGTYY